MKTRFQSFRESFRVSIWKAHFLQRAHTLFQGDKQREGDQARIAEQERMLGRATL